jgi:hypothetical protein
LHHCIAVDDPNSVNQNLMIGGMMAASLASNSNRSTVFIGNTSVQKMGMCPGHARMARETNSCNVIITVICVVIICLSAIAGNSRY